MEVHLGYLQQGGRPLPTPPEHTLFLDSEKVGHPEAFRMFWIRTVVKPEQFRG
jgi:hypothetical protein